MMSTKEKAQLVSETEAAQKKRQKKAREKGKKSFLAYLKLSIVNHQMSSWK